MRKFLSALRQHKQAFGTAWSAICAIGVIVGIVGGLPPAIQTAIDYGPDFISSPNTWWALAVFVVWLVVMRWIWRQPTVKSAEEIEKGFYSDILDMLEKQPLRVQRLMKFFLNTRSFYDVVRSIKGQDANIEYIMHVVEIVFPQRIDELLGREMRDKYLEVVAHARNKSNNAGIVCDTAIPMIQHEIMLAIDKEGHTSGGREASLPSIVGLLGN